MTIKREVPEVQKTVAKEIFNTPKKIHIPSKVM